MNEYETGEHNMDFGKIHVLIDSPLWRPQFIDIWRSIKKWNKPLYIKKIIEIEYMFKPPCQTKLVPANK